jgi:cytoskeletal protein CcmA (bactofilin family)
MRLLKKKIMSGALQFTIFISVLIALILAGILLLTYTNSFFRNQNAVAINNISISNNGVLKLCNTEYVTNDSIMLNFPDIIPGQQVKAVVKHWGVFDLATVSVRYKKMSYTKFALLGGKQAVKERNAIYLSETYKPLAIVADTKIVGKVILPNQGVRPGNISGHSYYKKSLIDGAISISKENLPELKYNYKAISETIKQSQLSADSDYISLKKGTIIFNSFAVPTKGYTSDFPIVLDDISLDGNIIIHSAEKIIVKKTAHLYNVILCAPIIVFEDEVSATIQVIAEEKIEIGKHCQLNYPSALVLNQKKEAKQKGKINIGKSTNVSGMVYYFKGDSLNEINSYPTNIYIAQGSIVKGEVYCEGNFEIRGKVSGMVYTNLFLTNENGTIFVNHLYDAEINCNDLHETYGGMLWRQGAKTVMKWLY